VRTSNPRSQVICGRGFLSLLTRQLATQCLLRGVRLQGPSDKIQRKTVGIGDWDRVRVLRFAVPRTRTPIRHAIQRLFSDRHWLIASNEVRQKRQAMTTLTQTGLRKTSPMTHGFPATGVRYFGRTIWFTPAETNAAKWLATQAVRP